LTSATTSAHSNHRNRGPSDKAHSGGTRSGIPTRATIRDAGCPNKLLRELCRELLRMRDAGCCGMGGRILCRAEIGSHLGVSARHRGGADGTISSLWEASPVWPNPVAESGTMPVGAATGFGQAGLASHRANGIDEGLWRPANCCKAALPRSNGVNRKSGAIPRPIPPTHRQMTNDQCPTTNAQ
jgi:hypothetical protein